MKLAMNKWFLSELRLEQKYLLQTYCFLPLCKALHSILEKDGLWAETQEDRA